MAALTGETTMRWFLIIAVSLAGLGARMRVNPTVSGTPGTKSQTADAGRARVLIDNARVRVYRTTADRLTGVAHGPAVVVALEDAPGIPAGTAVWADDAAAPKRTRSGRGLVVIVQPLRTAEAPASDSGTKPGDAPFTGMSFKPMFENDRVSVIRARMEVGAREAFHTHASDTVVVHLSGGEIEDTADGQTVVNSWKHGDAEFEGRGTSHSARNVGGAVDVVLVALKPR
jgi:quercetin dioxygenase-like cupin family protein